MVLRLVIFYSFLNFFLVHAIRAQDYDDGNKPAPEQNNCNGIFLTYTFVSRTREYPYIKNASAQPWAFNSMAYSFDGTMLEDLNTSIFLTGLPNSNYLTGETNGSDPVKEPRIPGKQQSVLTFTKNRIRDIEIVDGYGFPSKLFFNGEECALPMQLPSVDSRLYPPNFMLLTSVACVIFLVTTNI